MKPDCFDTESDWDYWREMEAHVRFVIGGGRPNSAPVNYCADCTLAYAEKMRDAGRCAHPEFMFKDGEEPLRSKPATHKGVSFHNGQQRWEVRFWNPKTGHREFIGYYDTVEEGVAAHESHAEKFKRDEAAWLLLRDNRKLDKARRSRV